MSYKKLLIIFGVLFLCLPAFGTTASDIRWGTDLNSNLASNTLKQWTLSIENRIGIGAPIGTGNTFYVDANVENEGDGSSWANARDTLDEAINLCTADNGDVIFVAQGHSETMGAAADVVDIDVDGVTIIGCGAGSLAPLYDYTDYDTGSFVIGADNVTLVNLRFCANTPDVNEAISISAGSTDVTIANCLFYCDTEGTDEFHQCINSAGAASDGLRIVNCEFRMGAGAAVAAIQTLDSDYMLIADCVTSGDYSTACIYNLTTASNHILIKDNILFNGTIGGTGGLNTEPCIELTSTTTGVIAHNFIACNVAADDNSVVGADMFLFDNIYTETEGSGVGISTAGG